MVLPGGARHPDGDGRGSGRSAHPSTRSNLFFLVVAVLSGVVGIVSLVHARTSTRLGVLVSVTTIPAASDWLSAARPRRSRAVLGDSPIPEESPAALLQQHHDLGGAPAARPGQCPASAREDEPVVTNGEAVMSAPAVSASVTQTLRIGHGAVLRAIQGNSVDVPLPVLGTVRLPPLDSLALYGGLAALAAIGLMEWPVAAAIGAGHLLVQQQHFRLLHDFGEALEKA